MASQWLRKSGMTLERRQNSPNGNPRYFAMFADGTRLPTVSDGQVNYLIPNPEYAGDVEIEVRGGEIINVREVTA